MPEQDAGARAERIRAFREEMQQLQRDGVLQLAPADRARVEAHHASVLSELAARPDVDLSAAERRLSWGMRVTSLLAAVALGAAVYFLFFRVWGLMTTPVQVAVLVAAPLLGIVATELVSRRDATGYFTGLVGVVAFTCFVINVVALGSIANLPASPLSFLAYGAFGLVLAYAHALRALLWLGLASLLAWLATLTGSLSGCCWFDSIRRPENFIGAGALLFLASVLLRHPPGGAFPRAYRVIGLFAVFVPVLVLANWADPSYLPWDPGTIRIVYQCLGFLVAGTAAGLGARAGWSETANLGVGFFVVLLYTKMFSWWWDAMPKYLFFLLLGIVGVALLLLLRRFRAATRRAIR